LLTRDFAVASVTNKAAAISEFDRPWAMTRSTTFDVNAHSPLFYQLLRGHGVLGEDAPAAIEMFSGRGQPTCEQLIDRYRIACRPVRDVLVDYLRERQGGAIAKGRLLAGLQPDPALPA
jgi:hypothetical protein